MNVLILHTVTVECGSGYGVAATTGYDPATDPWQVEGAMLMTDDFLMPRPYRNLGRVWAFDELRDSPSRRVFQLLSVEDH